MGLSKVYLETLRDGYEADGETRKAARDYFPQRKPGLRNTWHTAGESAGQDRVTNPFLRGRFYLSEGQEDSAMISAMISPASFWAISSMTS